MRRDRSRVHCAARRRRVRDRRSGQRIDRRLGRLDADVESRRPRRVARDRADRHGRRATRERRRPPLRRTPRTDDADVNVTRSTSARSERARAAHPRRRRRPTSDTARTTIHDGSRAPSSPSWSSSRAPSAATYSTRVPRTSRARAARRATPSATNRSGDDVDREPALEQRVGGRRPTAAIFAPASARASRPATRSAFPENAHGVLAREDRSSRIRQMRSSASRSGAGSSGSMRVAGISMHLARRATQSASLQRRRLRPRARDDDALAEQRPPVEPARSRRAARRPRR